VGLFRRRNETLNEQLLREAGLDSSQALDDSPPSLEPESSGAAPFPVGDVNLGHRTDRRSRTAPVGHVVTVKAETLAGDRIEFTTLPNGDILIDEEKGDGDLAPLAEVVERHVDPPYRAIAARQNGDVWAVGARQIQVAEFEFAKGDAIELTVNAGAVEVRVDGEQRDALIPPELERLGETLGDSFYVEAERIDGDLWEVRATAL